MSVVVNYQLQAHMSMMSRLDDTASPFQQHPQRQTTENPDGNSSIPTPSSNDADSDDFWSQPSPSTQAARDDVVTRVPSNIRMSLRGPSPTLDQNSDEFKRQAKEIKKDLQRWSRYAGRHARRKSKGPVCFEEGSKHTMEQLEHEHEFRRRVSVEQGKDFLLDFLQHHFEEHLGTITIKSNKTLEEIKMIGNEELPVGVRQCRRLFNAPVISDQVGLLLWQELRQGDALCHSHEVPTQDEGSESHILEMEVIQQTSVGLLLEGSMAEYIAQSQVCGGVLGQLGVQIHNHNCTCRGMAASAQDLADSAPRTAMLEGVVAAAASQQAAGASIPMERRTLDGFLEGIKRRTSRGAGYFAGSLATGYA